MSSFVMADAEDRNLWRHLALYGLADVLVTAGVPNVTLGWERTRPVIDGDGLNADVVDRAVRDHLAGRAPWVGHTLGAERRGTMSPRLSRLTTDEAWRTLQSARHEVLDALTDGHAWSDLRFVAALGEPSYWRFTSRDEPLQDDGASRWEMQPRNRGSEFVGNRLRPLTEKLARRRPGLLAAGLTGDAVIDELGGKADSVSATGLSMPGPVDNALVWCALWGIGQFPTALSVERRAQSSGHDRQGRSEWFHVPVWSGRWRPARLRSVLASAQLCRFAAGEPASDAATVGAAAAWLRARHVAGVLRFRIDRFGSDNAPERRARSGDAIPVR